MSDFNSRTKELLTYCNRTALSCIYCKEPKLAAAYYLLQKAYMVASQKLPASAGQDQIRQAQNWQASILNNLGCLYFELGGLEGSATWFAKAAKCCRDASPPLADRIKVNAAMVLLQAGRHRQASILARRALEERAGKEDPAAGSAAEASGSDGEELPRVGLTLQALQVEADVQEHDGAWLASLQLRDRAVAMSERHLADAHIITSALQRAALKCSREVRRQDLRLWRRVDDGKKRNSLLHFGRRLGELSEWSVLEGIESPVDLDDPMPVSFPPEFLKSSPPTMFA
ncbi:unnamed protein product [Chrysoparadoxa australica]